MAVGTVALIVMAKWPRAGRVKTRLIGPRLTPEQAAGIHRAFLLHLIGRLVRMRPGELVICYDPPDAGRDMRALLTGVGDAIYVRQAPGDLGARLARVVELVRVRHERVLLLGVDSPDLPTGHLTRAAELTAGADVTIGRTDDGGYWCLGLRREVDAGQLLSAGIEWSSGREAGQTLKRARSLGYTTAEAPRWDDVDRPDDLNRLLGRLRRSPDADDQHLFNRLEPLIQTPTTTTTHQTTEPLR